MGKDNKKKIDELIEEQRKNLRFVDAAPVANDKDRRFITIDDVAEPSHSITRSSPLAKANVNNSSTAKNKIEGYVDIRKFKMDRAKKLAEEQQAAVISDVEEKAEQSNGDYDDNEDLFGIDYVMNKQNSKIDQARENFDKFPKSDSFFSDIEDVVPEPKSVRRPRVEKEIKEKRTKKVDPDLIIKKTNYTFFDDFES